MSSSRRDFLAQAGVVSAAFAALGACEASAQSYALPNSRFGALVPDPNGIMDLPRGYRYAVLSRTGDLMSDGHLTPGRPDGMATFRVASLGRDRLSLIRNHELAPEQPGSPFHAGKPASAITRDKTYDVIDGGAMPGGTTTLVYNVRTQQVEKSYLSLAGTIVNCAGGPTPWGSWITCEETDVTGAEIGTERDHGYVFDVPAEPDGKLVDPIALTGLGRFEHEAVAIDPRTGIVYLTEDDADGLFYRFLPAAQGELAKGGRLQALVVLGQPGVDTRNWDTSPVSFAPRKRLKTAWVDLAAPESPDKDLRFRGRKDGAAVFARGEGMWFGKGEVYFTATSGGKAQNGQIWRYKPSRFEGTPDEVKSPGLLELFSEPNDESRMQRCDNITFSPRGDIFICEDGPEDNYLRFVAPNGAVSTFARNAYEGKSELTGVCFSPDGSTMFVNIQVPGITLAITGPWGRSV